MYRRAFTTGLLTTALTALPRLSVAAPNAIPCTVMTISYDGTQDNPIAPIAVTDAMIRSLPRHSFETTTIWTTGVQRFTGVPLWILLDHYGIEGLELELSAANDYRITIPMAEIGPKTPLVAYERNGKPMSARDYGPLWLVYDYDDDATSRSQTAFSRSIWQLDHITVTR